MYFNQEFYSSPEMYGSGSIIKNYLKLDKDFVLPITIPHGVNPIIAANIVIQDLHNHEPIYMAFTKQMNEKVKKIKKTISFPHPWLFLIDNLVNTKSSGTLFIAPANFRDNYECLYNKILQHDQFVKPHAVLVKKRDSSKEVVKWWAKKNIKVETAGNVFDIYFYKNLLEIFLKYSFIATPYMSSAAIFAAAIKKKILLVSDLVIKEFEDLEITQLHKLDSDTYNDIRNVWINILSSDVDKSSLQAKKLLGYEFLDNIDNLRNKLTNIINENKKFPLHLHPLKVGNNNFLYKIVVFLSKNKIPLYKIFPNPLNKIYLKILIMLKLNYSYVYEISDFGYFKISGKFETPKFSTFRSKLLRPKINKTFF